MSLNLAEWILPMSVPCRYFIILYYMQLMLRRSVFNVQTESANMNYHKAYKSCFVGMLVFLLSSHIARKSKILMAHNF